MNISVKVTGLSLRITPTNGYSKEIIRSVLGIVFVTIHGYIITHEGSPITHKSGLKKGFLDACKDGKMPYGRKIPDGITFHDFMRTVKTNMAKACVAGVYREMILVHALTAMDRHYIVGDDESLHAAMDKYTAWLDHEFDQNVDQVQKTG
jgi:hypothetical protein